MQNLYTEFSNEPLYVAKFICSPTLLLKNWDASRLILELDHDSELKWNWIRILKFLQLYLMLRFILDRMDLTFCI